jgi:hypothetical protein
LSRSIYIWDGQSVPLKFCPRSSYCCKDPLKHAKKKEGIRAEVVKCTNLERYKTMVGCHYQELAGAEGKEYKV